MPFVAQVAIGKRPELRVFGNDYPTVDGTDRRPGDIATCYADPTLARNELSWSAEYDIDAMVTDAWRRQSNNPEGFN